METRANFVLVMSFVAAIVGLAAIGAIVLLNLHPFPDTRAFYDINFRGSVAGLKVEAPVSLAGIPIGNVRKVQLDPSDPSVVHVTIEVQRGVAIRTDSVAALDVSLVFGDASVSITGGSDRAPLLPAVPGPPYAVIVSRPPQLTATWAEDLIARTLTVSETILNVLDEKGMQAITDKLQEIERASARGVGTAERFGGMVDDVGAMVHDAHDQASALTAKLDNLTQTLVAAQAQFDNADGIIKKVNAETRDADNLVQGTRPELVDLTQNTLRTLHGTISDLRVTVRNIARYIADFERDPMQSLFGKPRAGYKPK